MTAQADPKTASLGTLNAPSLAGVRLEVVSGPDMGKMLTLGAGTVVVGKGADCDLVLTDAAVSRKHLSVDVLERRLRVTDLGSKNGTRYLGARVQAVDVPVGASIELGATKLTLVPASERVQEQSDRTELEGLVGTSLPMRRLFWAIEQAARTDVAVLVLGETGTGKEGVAAALHRRSSRARGPLCVFDCASTPAEQIQAALFGYAKGAFTGAVKSSPGLLAEANGGTLFLDEVGDLPLELQPNLLRALESSTFTPLGSIKPVHSDFRVVAATHRDLGAAVASGAFRQDLYFRLASVVLTVPPLRERLEDIPLLAERFAQEAHASLKLTPVMLARLYGHRWPGNVRELRNVVRRAVALDTDANPGEESAEAEADDGLRKARERAVKAFEKSYLVWLLEKNQGSRAAAAREARVGRSYLYRLLDEHKLGIKKD